MSWFVIALLGYFTLSLVSISDKFILSKKLATPAVFVFYTTVPLLVLFVTLFFNVKFLPKEGMFLAAVSGLSLLFGFWAMYKGFLKSEVSHAGPLLGAAIPTFVFLISVGLMNEILTEKQLIACIFLIFGSLLISFEQSPEHSGWHRGFLWIIISGAFFAVSHVAAKYLYDVYGFLSGLVWTRGLSGFFGLILLATPSVRIEICSWFKKEGCSSETAKNEKKIWLILFNKIFGVIGVLLIQLATALGSVSLVNAMAGVQFGLLVILVGILSLFFPRIFKEEYNKLEIVQEAIAVVVIGIGLGLLL
ncbi:MAG TPA: hypothetical protein P5230_01175 [Candidatus Magasanikbacteria bacterium]|nr:hypothetical protein [Candidatus Magasanikbacteria bacterium]